MLSVAELLLGLSRHLSTYTLGPDRAALGSLEFAGNVLEMAMRLRGSGVSSGPRVQAIGFDVGIARRRLDSEVLPTLEALGWVDVTRDQDGDLYSVSERIPPLAEVVHKADAILAMARPDGAERAVLKILDATTMLPLTRASALEVAMEVSTEQEAERALNYL